MNARIEKYLSQSRTRGVRNNSPYNIKVSPNRWKGKIPPSQKKDPVFEEFPNMFFGIRAGILLLRHYILDGYNTLNTIIPRYAPASENHVQNYINYLLTFFDETFTADTPISFGLDSLDFYLLNTGITLYESNYEITRDMWSQVFGMFPELIKPAPEAIDSPLRSDQLPPF